MKIIIVKKFRDWKPNQIVEVSNGFAKNFLFKQKIAIPLTKKTQKVLSIRLEKISYEDKQQIELAKQLLTKIETLKLVFKLRKNEHKVSGAITNKQVLQKLEEVKISLNKYMLPHININKLGKAQILVKLHKDVIAKLNIEVLKDD